MKLNQVVVQTPKKPIYHSLWFWWIMTSAIHFELLLFNPFASSGLLNLIYRFMNIFVPYGGIYVIYLFYRPLYSLISLGVFMLALFYIDRYLDKKNIAFGVRVLINIIVLILLTMVIDLIRLIPFKSWDLLFNGVEGY